MRVTPLLVSVLRTRKKQNNGGLFGLPVLPPVGGGEHLPALLPDLRHFRLLRYWHRLAHRRDVGLSRNLITIVSKCTPASSRGRLWTPPVACAGAGPAPGVRSTCKDSS